MGISFLSVYAHAWNVHIYICKEHEKQKDQNAFKNDCKRVSRRCGSYMMYLKGNSPHQKVMIVCEVYWITSYLESS